VRIVAFSDIHLPTLWKEFHNLFNNLDSDLCIIAGDLTDNGNTSMVGSFLYSLKKGCSNIVAVFGNNDYDVIRSELKWKYNYVKWLEEEVFIIDNLIIVGSIGFTEKINSFMLRRRNTLVEMEERWRKVTNLLRKAKEIGGKVILVTHYSPTFKTLRGEEERAWPYLGYRFIETIDENLLPDISIHGHAHKGEVEMAEIRNTSVYNVALPARRKLTIIKG
jgi:Icc-related predicted phosphoesterase